MTQPTPDTGAGTRAWSMRAYLALIVVSGTVALLAAAGYGFWWSAQTARSDALAEMGMLAERAAESIGTAVSPTMASVEGLAAQPGLEAVFDDPTGCTLAADGSAPFTRARLDLVRADGVVSCSSDPAVMADDAPVHAHSAWLEEVLDGAATHVTWEGVDAVEDEPALSVAAPIAPDGEPVGAVVAFLPLDPVGPAMADDVPGSVRPNFSLVDSATGSVVSTSAAGGGNGASLTFPRAGDEGEWEGLDGAMRLFGSADVPGTDWRVYAGVPRSGVLADARGALWRGLAVGLVAMLVLFAAVAVLDRRIAGPLRAVTGAVERASASTDPVHIDERGTAELIALTRHFNTMMDIRAGHDAQLVHQATHDPLTGLPNRMLLSERLEDTLRAGRLGAGVAVLFFDIDRFSVVNDSLGHDAGDRLLNEVAGRLSRALRPHDTLTRSGGDLFVILCEDIDEREAIQVAERLHRSIEAPFSGPMSDIVLRASIGIAVAVQPGTPAAQVLREADSALHQAKGTDSPWCMFDPSLQTRATLHLEVEHALSQALERDELVVHYQPLVDIASGRTVGAEALVRWEHPERGLVPPMEFIPIAEETGQIGAIGRFVLLEACRQAAAWIAAGHPLRMSVNVAVAQLRQGGFPDLVAQVLAETGLPPEMLCLEVTESSLMTASEQSAGDLTRLRAAGVHVAIDDFGTGYSSLSYLHDLPISELKIDRSFIRRAGQAGTDSHVLEAIIGMARALGLRIVAEGVETDAQLEFLAGHECQLAQGYLFARPQPPAELLAELVRTMAPARLN